MFGRRFDDLLTIDPKGVWTIGQTGDDARPPNPETPDTPTANQTAVLGEIPPATPKDQNVEAVLLVAPPDLTPPSPRPVPKDIGALLDGFKQLLDSGNKKK